MYKIVVAGSLALLLCACGTSQPPAASSAQATSAPAAASSAFADDQPEEVTPPRSAAELSADMVHKVLSSSARSKADKKLDADRHPSRTLAFFGLRPDMSVIEVEPGTGWYAAILAPLLKQNGTYTAAMVSSLTGKQANQTNQTMQALRKAFRADPQHYGRARLASFDPHTPNLGTPGSADMVLSFRDAHAWVAQGTAHAMLRAIYDVLKPGGVLGLVDYRTPEDAGAKELKQTPYLRQSSMVKLATEAGFKLDAASNINANPDKVASDKKAPVGADRMTLRFIKPTKSKHATDA